MGHLSNSLQFLPSEAQILSNFFLTQFKFAFRIFACKEEFPTKRFPCWSTRHRAIFTDIPTHNTSQRMIFISKGYSDSERGGGDLDIFVLNLTAIATPALVAPKKSATSLLWFSSFNLNSTPWRGFSSVPPLQRTFRLNFVCSVGLLSYTSRFLEVYHLGLLNRI